MPKVVATVLLLDSNQRFQSIAIGLGNVHEYFVFLESV